MVGAVAAFRGEAIRTVRVRAQIRGHSCRGRSGMADGRTARTYGQWPEPFLRVDETRTLRVAAGTPRDPEGHQSSVASDDLSQNVPRMGERRRQIRVGKKSVGTGVGLTRVECDSGESHRLRPQRVTIDSTAIWHTRRINHTDARDSLLHWTSRL